MIAGSGAACRAGGIGGLGIVAIALIAMFLGVDPSIILNGLPGAAVTSEPAVVHGTGDPGRRAGGRVRLGGAGADRGHLGRHLRRRPGSSTSSRSWCCSTARSHSACGMAGSATGPFYCPADQKVYLDLSFFDELEQRFGAPGDFAQAYVIAHEVGHHVQTLLGISSKVEPQRARRRTRRRRNQLSVMMELQADCFAGVWARHTARAPGVLEHGDIEEGLAAASAVGDDRIQKATRGYVVPDAFTHGSSQQRMRWFKQGLQTGDVNSCDTFQAQRALTRSAVGGDREPHEVDAARRCPPRSSAPRRAWARCCRRARSPGARRRRRRNPGPGARCAGTRSAGCRQASTSAASRR